MGSEGRRKMLGCGHIGEAVIGQFYLCPTKDCDGKPACPKCGSRRVHPFSSASTPDGTWHCWTCGKCWFVP